MRNGVGEATGGTWPTYSGWEGAIGGRRGERGGEGTGRRGREKEKGEREEDEREREREKKSKK